MRFSAFGDAALGEPEQDANSALTELDKGSKIIHILKFDAFILYITLFVVKVNEH